MIGMTEYQKVVAQKDAAYKERNALVCLLSKVFRSWLARHDETDSTWEDDWRWIVFIDLPTGQCTWHIHDSELENFAHLPVNGMNDGKVWDGHTTEEKYKRVADMSPNWKAVQIADEEMLTIWNTSPWLNQDCFMSVESKEEMVSHDESGRGILAAPSND